MNYDLLDRYIIHYVTDKSYGKYADIHTHGLEENFSHKDIQMVIPYKPETVSSLINIIVDMIDKGTTFEPGIKYPGFCNSGDVEFIPCKERGRIVLRMLIPDNFGTSPLSPICAEYWCEQPYFNPELEVIT